MMSAHKHHIAFVVTPSAKEAVADKLGDFETGKGSLKIPHGVDVPVQSIEAMIDERSREYREDGAKVDVAPRLTGLLCSCYTPPVSPSPRAFLCVLKSIFVQ